jgi:hypothetical protein
MVAARAEMGMARINDQDRIKAATLHLYLCDETHRSSHESVSWFMAKLRKEDRAAVLMMKSYAVVVHERSSIESGKH